MEMPWMERSHNYRMSVGRKGPQKSASPASLFVTKKELFPRDWLKLKLCIWFNGKVGS